MEPIKQIYQTNPEFVKDVLHLHFFKTSMYYGERMDDFPRLRISSQLKTSFFMVDYATNYSVENGVYKFKIKSDSFLFLPEKAPFPLLFNLLIGSGFKSLDIEDMFKKFYNSENPILVGLAEQFKNKNISLSTELFEFIKRKECNPLCNWEINEIISGVWNYTLLALNEKVWETAFNIKFLNDLFRYEKIELDKIDAGNVASQEEYFKHLDRVDKIIDQKLH